MFVYMNTATETEMVTCPNCEDGIRSTSPLIHCGTCWGKGVMSAEALARAIQLAVAKDY